MAPVVIGTYDPTSKGADFSSRPARDHTGTRNRKTTHRSTAPSVAPMIEAGTALSAPCIDHPTAPPMSAPTRPRMSATGRSRRVCGGRRWTSAACVSLPMASPIPTQPVMLNSKGTSARAVMAHAVPDALATCRRDYLRSRWSGAPSTDDYAVPSLHQHRSTPSHPRQVMVGQTRSHWVAPALRRADGGVGAGDSRVVSVSWVASKRVVGRIDLDLSHYGRTTPALIRVVKRLPPRWWAQNERACYEGQSNLNKVPTFIPVAALRSI